MNPYHWMRKLVFLEIMFAFLFNPVSLMAQSTSGTLEVGMTWSERVNADTNVRFNHQNVVFKQQPPNVSNRAGVIAGANISFGINVRAGKLYVDFNNNLILGDDKPVEKSNEKLEATPDLKGQMIFRNISLQLSRESILFPYRCYMYSYESFASVWIESGWSGTFELDGKQYQAVYVDNFDGIAGLGDTLKIYAKGTQAPLSPWFSQYPGLIVLGTRTFRFSIEFLRGTNAPEARLRLIPDSTATGEVRITGKGIDQMGLKSDKWVLVVQPGPEIYLPPSLCSVVAINVGNQLSVIDINAGFNGAGQNNVLSVERDKPAHLVCGGPLTGSIHVNRIGDTLDLAYTVKGIGGEYYQPTERWTSAAGFAMFLDGKQIGSGTFQSNRCMWPIPGNAKGKLKIVPTNKNASIQSTAVEIEVGQSRALRMLLPLATIVAFMLVIRFKKLSGGKSHALAKTENTVD